MAMELASLHNQTYDLSRITISLDDVHDTFPLAGCDMKIASGTDGHIHEIGVDNIVGPSEQTTIAVGDMDGVSEHEVVTEILQPGETPLPSENKMDEHHDTVVEDGITQHVTVAADTISPQLEHRLYPPENAVGESSSIPEGVDIALVANIELGDVGQSSDGAVQVSGLDKGDAIDAPAFPSDEKREECVEVDTSLVDGNGQIEVEEGLVKDGDAVTAVENMPDAKNNTSLDVNHHGGAVETESNCNEQGQHNVSAPSIEIETETDLGRVEYHDQLFHEDISAEPPIVGSSYPQEGMNVQGSSLDDWEYALQHEPYPANAMDGEISGIDMHDVSVHLFG